MIEDPEFGLREIGSLDEGDGYSWNTLSVFIHNDGRLFWIEGSGCSCNDLWDGINSVDDLNRLTQSTRAEFEEAVKQFPVDGPDKIELLAKVAELLK